MDNHQVIAIYEDAARLTREMLDDARAQQWDKVVAKEKLCAAQLARLPSAEPPQNDPRHQRRKAELIGSMLDDNAEIRMLAEPWLARLSELIGNTRQQSRLHHMYRG
jgi:flagellar protein FliT